MPPMKRATAPKARRSKRLRTNLSEAGPSLDVENPPMPKQQTGQREEIQGRQGVLQLEERALTITISVAVAQAVKEAMAAHQASFPSTATPTPSAAVEQVVQNEVISYTPGAMEQAPLPAVIGAGDQPSHPFCSIALNLGCGRTLKSKRKFGLMHILTLGHCYLLHPLIPCSFHGFQWGYCKSTSVNS